MAKPKTEPDKTENFTHEITSYVTPEMGEQLTKIAREKGVSVSVIGRWAFTQWLKEQRR